MAPVRKIMKKSNIAFQSVLLKIRRSSALIGLTVLLVIQLFPEILSAQKQDSTQLDGTDGLVFTIPGVDSATGKEKNLAPNEFGNPYATFKIGLGFIEDYVAYSQSKVFKQQMDTAGFHLDPTF
jgi:phosphate-selective porin OprO/OprP